MKRALFLAIGIVLTGAGIVGAFLPLVPSTIFFIMAAYCFAQSNKRLEDWLMNHKWFGPNIHAWRERGAISQMSKFIACSSMLGGILFFWLFAKPALLLGLTASAFIAGCFIFVATRPST